MLHKESQTKLAVKVYTIQRTLVYIVQLGIIIVLLLGVLPITRSIIHIANDVFLLLHLIRYLILIFTSTVHVSGLFSDKSFRESIQQSMRKNRSSS